MSFDKLDVLNREQFVDRLINLMDNLSDNEISVSFAIDGVWGSGKSFVLDMFEDRLSVKHSEDTMHERYYIIRYNCWKYDYYDEPLVAMVATILEAIEKNDKILYGKNGARIKGVLKAVGATILNIACKNINDATGVDLKSAYEFVKKAVEEGDKDYSSANSYDVYFAFNEALHSLQKILSELSEEYTIVFLVDELDRCLPEYAIKVLERLHHLIEDTKNIINIIAVDKGNLQKSVQHLFGFENPDNYLKKFIQFTVPLTVGEVSESISAKYQDYIDLFDKDIFACEDSIDEFMQMIFKDIDVRTQEQLVKRAKVAHALLYKDKKDYSFMCMELLLTVLIQYYGDSCNLLNPLPHKFSGLFRNASTEINGFMEEKFAIIDSRYSYNGLFNGIEYVLPETPYLYGAILFTWYYMHPSSKDYVVHHTQGDVYEVIKSNHNELKKFVETIKLIK